MTEKEPYGCELVLDMHECDAQTFTRTSIRGYFKKLCKAIGMTRCDLHFWDDVGVAPEEQQTSPHTKGTSAVQFIITSSVVIHTLDLMGAVYINIFSCKPFKRRVAEKLTTRWFGAKSYTTRLLERV